MAYRIIFAQSVRAQLEALPVRQRHNVLEAIEQQLTHEPLLETRNRKVLRPNPVAPWELRVGQLRVFYEVVAAPEKEPTETEASSKQEQGVVQVLAVGQKRGGVLRIAGKKIQL
jgi:mRNA-degrading endonuclease RelE of RelBE toxin-antitoxin system